MGLTVRQILSLIALTLAFRAAHSAPPDEITAASPLQLESVSQAPDPWKTVEMEWEKVDKAVTYEVKLAPVEGGKERIFSVPTNHFVQDMPVGNYFLQI